MLRCGILEPPYDLAAIVDPVDFGETSAGDMDGGEDDPVRGQKPDPPGPPPTTWPLSLIPLRKVFLAPGTSIMVKVTPSEVKNPWNPMASMKSPTI